MSHRKPIKILTYNICHECMSNTQSSRGSASKYASKCIHNKKNICRDNVIEILERAINENFDIIGLQEASKTIIEDRRIKQYLYKKNHMSYVHSTSNREEMITLINIERFNILAAIPGNFYWGRPYQIIFLEERHTTNFFIIINIHNGKDIVPNPKLGTRTTICTKDTIKSMIGERIDLAHGVIPSSLPLVDILDPNKHKLTRIDSIIENKNFNTIILGDFNDLNNNQYFWQDFQIFQDVARFHNLRNIIVSTNGIKPPDTCCYNSPHPSLTGITMVGDYISIDNSKLKYKTQNKIYGKTYDYASDHFPVYAEILLRDPNQPHRQQIPQPHRQQIPHPSQTNEPIIYYSKHPVFLRLLNDRSKPDKIISFNIPNNNNIPINFRGRSIDTNTELIFPNGKKYKGRQNNYTCVMVKNSPYIIGYINCKYIRCINRQDREYQLFPTYEKKLLRLIPIDDDPRSNINIRGLVITSDDVLIFPNGQTIRSSKIIPDDIKPIRSSTTSNKMILVQDRNDPKKIGYINKEYLIRTN